MSVQQQLQQGQYIQRFLEQYYDPDADASSLSAMAERHYTGIKNAFEINFLMAFMQFNCHLNAVRERKVEQWYTGKSSERINLELRHRFYMHYQFKDPCPVMGAVNRSVKVVYLHTSLYQKCLRCGVQRFSDEEMDHCKFRFNINAHRCDSCATELFDAMQAAQRLYKRADIHAVAMNDQYTREEWLAWTKVPDLGEEWHAARSPLED